MGVIANMRPTPMEKNKLASRNSSKKFVASEAENRKPWRRFVNEGQGASLEQSKF
jgi:hypothetical protein